MLNIQASNFFLPISVWKIPISLYVYYLETFWNLEHYASHSLTIKAFLIKSDETCEASYNSTAYS